MNPPFGIGKFNYVELESSFVYPDDQHGIVCVKIKDNYCLELDDAIEITKAIGHIGGGGKYPILLEAGIGSSADHNAREFSAGPEGTQYTIADAIVVNSTAQKLIANFYLKFHKPLIPSKLFNSRESAITWLKQQKKS